MSTIKLTPKYETIKRKLVESNRHPYDNNTNKIIELYAKMVAQGLQLAEELAEKEKKEN